MTTPGESRLAYIDGLRAIAIVSVVGFHAGIPGFAGGFAGVDIFFAISGFLIIGQIIDEVQLGTFSFARFYSRRVLRILPPLLIVAGAVVIAAFLMPMIPRDIERISKSAMASAAMVANWYFMSQGGYFALPSATEPLLHMWSLGVEEQFYLVGPITLVALALAARRLGKPAMSVWLLATLLGLVASLVVFFRADPEFAFYATPSRAWELLAGGLGALVLRTRFSLSMETARAACVAGLTLILAGVLLIGFQGQHRAWHLLLPVFGTVAVLVTGTFHYTGVAVRALALRPLVGIGLISYGWYLWHWPLGVLWRATQFDPLSTTQRMVAVVIIPFLLAVATYFGVEKPLRAWRKRPHIAMRPRTVVLAGVAASVMLTATAGALALRSSSLARDQRIRPFIEAQRRPWDACPFAIADAELSRCQIGVAPVPRAIVWGDSHAGSLFGALEAATSDTGTSAYLRWTPGCPPLDAPLVSGGRQADDCMRDNAAVLGWLRSPQADSISGVVLASRWANAGELYAIGSLAEVDSERPRSLQSALGGTIETLTALGLRVLVVGPVPEFPYRAPECIFLASNYSRDVHRCLAARSAVILQQRAVLQDLKAAAAPHANARLIDPLDAFCDDGWCRPEQEGEILFGDMHHLSSAGGRVLYERFRDAFAWTLGAS